MQGKENVIPMANTEASVLFIIFSLIPHHVFSHFLHTWPLVHSLCFTHSAQHNTYQVSNK